MEICPEYAVSAPPLPDGYQRRLPRLEESFDDCGYLFARFKHHLKSGGQAGIVAINVPGDEGGLDGTDRTIALLIRLLGKKLSGQVEGGYRAGDGEFFLLLVPVEAYGEELFQSDMAVIRREVGRYLSLPHFRYGVKQPGVTAAVTVDGVFLCNRDGEKADNALFRAFQELFGASVEPPRYSAEREAIGEIIRCELITPVFQPIVSFADGTVYGHESLSRISRPGLFTNPEEMFGKAQACNLTGPLERLCRRKALTRARELGIGGQLFLNVCPALLHANDHERGYTAALLEQLGIAHSRVTFELTEKTLIEDYGLFNRVLSHYRAQGYSIAIDDLGCGYAGLKMLAQLEPEYVKLARFLIAGIDTSNTRQALVEALVTFCSRIGARVIAEGIEREEEMEFLVSAGVSFGQGYLLGPPTPAPPQSGAFRIRHG